MISPTTTELLARAVLSAFQDMQRAGIVTAGSGSRAPNVLDMTFNAGSNGAFEFHVKVHTPAPLIPCERVDVFSDLIELGEPDNDYGIDDRA